MRLSALIFAVCTLPAFAGATACAAPTAEEASGESTSALGSYTASYCEAFVDKVAPEKDSHSYRSFRVFVKTLNDRLDGPIKRVAMRATSHDRSDSSCASGSPLPGFCEPEGVWTDLDARKIADDYFEVNLPIGVFGFSRQVEGVFFVETERGTKLWVKPLGGGNFFFDDNGIDQVYHSLHGHGITTPLFSSTSIDALPKTADFFDYLNPARCR